MPEYAKCIVRVFCSWFSFVQVHTPRSPPPRYGLSSFSTEHRMSSYSQHHIFVHCSSSLWCLYRFVQIDMLVKTGLVVHSGHGFKVHDRIPNQASPQGLLCMWRRISVILVLYQQGEKNGTNQHPLLTKIRFPQGYCRESLKGPLRLPQACSLASQHSKRSSYIRRLLQYRSITLLHLLSLLRDRLERLLQLFYLLQEKP